MTHGGIWFRPFVGHVPLWVTSHCGSRPTVGYVPPWVRPAVGLCHRESRPSTVPPWVTSRRGSRHAVVDSDVPPWVASSCVSDCVTSAVGPSPRGCVPPWVTSRHCPARGSRLAMAHVPSWVRSRSGSYPTVFSFRRGSVPPRSRPPAGHVPPCVTSRRARKMRFSSDRYDTLRVREGNSRRKGGQNFED